MSAKGIELPFSLGFILQSLTPNKRLITINFTKL